MVEDGAEVEEDERRDEHREDPDDEGRDHHHLTRDEPRCNEMMKVGFINVGPVLSSHW